MVVIAAPREDSHAVHASDFFVQALATKGAFAQVAPP